MRFSEIKLDDKTILIDETRTRASSISLPYRDRHSPKQCYSVQQDRIPFSTENPTPSSDYLYREIVKAIGRNDFADEKRSWKRASWSPSVPYEHGLPPSGRRLDNELPVSYRNFHPVRMRPKVTRYYQPKQQSNSRSWGRPASFNENYDRYLTEHQSEKLTNSSLTRTNTFSIQQCEPSSSSSSSSVDTIVQITTRASPSLDTSDFISDTSTASSVTTTNTVTSLASTILSQASRQRSPSYERLYSSAIRPLLNEYQQDISSQIDYKLSPPVSQANTNRSSSSPISSLFTASFPFTCSKGHEPTLSSSIGSSLNQYAGFTSQTLNIDTLGDNISSPTIKTTRSVMTMSMSPNRHHSQMRSAKAIITTAQTSPIANVTITTNNTDGLKQQQQRDQTESTSVSNNGCLKSPTNKNNRIKKSVHFDCHLPRNIRVTSPVPIKESCCCRSLTSTRASNSSDNNNYRPTVTIASSSPLFNGDGDSDEQKTLCDDQRLVGTSRENERNETTRRTIAVNPLTTTTRTILRSFSLSPSPLSKEKSNSDSRGQEQEEEEEEEEREKENVDELNCTTSRRVTTAATHLHRTTTTATVTFNDGSNNVSQKKESNNTNNSNTNFIKRQSLSVDRSMPLNNLLVKTTSLSTIINPQISQQSPTSSSAKKLLSNGFLSLIGRSNSNHSKSSTSTEENKQLRRTSSTQLRAQRKAKQQTTLTTGTNGNKRLSADVESILPVSSNNNHHHCETSNEDTHTFDKVATSQAKERQSTMSLVPTPTDKNISSSNIDSSVPLCTNSNGITNSISMSTNSSTTIIKSDEGDSLNNGLLFRPVTDPKCDYVLHNHQTVQKEPFFLSPPKSLSNGDESTMMQTSTLIITTPPQYHYYLYPPINNTNTLSSSSSSSSVSSSSKKKSKVISTANRTISNVSINSVSTSSSSSYPSCESQPPDNDYQQSSQIPLNAEDETLSSSTVSILHNNIMNNKTHQKKVVHSALIDWKLKSSSENSSDSTTKTKPVILSDSVQAFWPPPPSPSTLGKHSGLTATEQAKQSESIPIPNHTLNSSYNNESLNANHTDLLSTKEEIRSYTEEYRFNNGCLRNASDTSLEDTQASYTERLREKSRSISMNGPNDMFSNFKRSVSKDALNDCHMRSNTHLHFQEIPSSTEHTLRPKSAGQQTRAAHIISKSPAIENDFQSKREFFENRTYTDNTSSNLSLTSIQTNILPTKPKIYTLSPSTSSQTNNNNRHLLHQTISNNSPQRSITRRSWNDLSFRQLQPPSTPPPLPPPMIPPAPASSEAYFESTLNQTSFVPIPTIRKPVRIVKAIQRSSPPTTDLSLLTTRPLTTSKTYSLAKPGLFSASPISSAQKLPSKSSTTTPRRFPSRDENDLQSNLKEFLLRYSHNHSLNELDRLTISNDYHLSTDYTRSLFPIPDRLRRIRSRQSSGGDTSSITTSSNSSSDYIHRTVSNDSCIFDDDDALRQAEDLLCSLKKRLESLKENQRIIHEETEDNKILGAKLISIIESTAEPNEIEKFKLHINEIDTITSVLLKLSSRLAKVENDLSSLPENSEQIKASLIDRREKAQQKHDEAKSLKDGIDRRSRTVTTILRKYFSNEQYDDYEHFIRMKSTLLIDGKENEENISIIEKQIDIFNHILMTDYPHVSTGNSADNLQTNSWKPISSTA